MLNQWQIAVTVLRTVLLIGSLCAQLAACGGASARGDSRPAPPALSLSTGNVLAAIGVKSSGGNDSGAGDAVWQDPRVAFGLTNLLAESFYETGKFRLVEEKTLTQQRLLDELVEIFASASHSEPSEAELASLGRRLAADLLAYGRVGASKASGRRVVIGPAGSYQQRWRIAIEVCLYAVSTQQTLCRSGEGIAQQEGVGLVYEFRHDRPDFAKTAAGLATQQAVTSAVQALMASIRFAP
jgi:hypothetical protein